MNNWKRQHPTAIFIGFISNLKELIFTVIAVLIFGQSSQAGGTMFYTIFFSLILVVSLGNGIIKWVTFRYQLAEDELKIKQGLIFRKRRYIRKERIQSIDLNEKLLQRLFRLVEVRIETAGGGSEPEFRIVALKKQEALEIKNELLHKNPAEKTSEMEETGESLPMEEKSVSKTTSDQPYQWKLTGFRLFITAITSSGIGIAATFVAAITSQVQQFIPDAFYEQFIGWLLHSSILFIGFWVVVILFIGWFITLISTLLKYGMFQIEKQLDEIHITRGVLERRNLTLSATRITSVRIVQNILRQPFGFVSVYVESAGGGRKEEDLSTILIPLCKRKEVTQILENVLPEYAVDMVYTPLPKESVRRYIVRLIFPSVIIAGLLTYFLSYGWISFLLPIMAAGYGFWQYVDAGIGKNESLLWIRSRAIARTEVLIPRKRIQAMTTTQTFLQKFDLLFSVHVSIITSIIGKTFTLRHISKEQSEECYLWYSYEETENNRED
ncbi:PH domain-containing protein [Evansella tamaricis]|uniref:PH domain-containing protein n=1 Tax=Evansella tamaricis TaxID=2069301 RepID=A0ABS6JD29_9BACI|nr:PH domain-containing protein [Evansella tamaricis]MBU9711330.1 PH domain-containing protein [Evansella tamaricis]